MELNFDEWLQYGIDNGFCSEQYCATHDGPPYSQTEALVWEDGGDLCLHSVRLGSVEDWEMDAKAYLELSEQWLFEIL